jgi:hypothetical protein
VSVLAFSNWYSGDFSDSKLSGVEIIHHGVRTVTNGDVRLSAAPAQWDPLPVRGDRKVDSLAGLVQTELSYPRQNLRYRIDVEARDASVLVSVHLLPPRKTGTVLQGLITPNSIPGWTRRPVIAHSQVGYHPT